MESLYSKFYSGGENLNRRNIYPDKRILSYSLSQPIIHLKDYINYNQNNYNNKLKNLENKIYDLQNGNKKRRNILMSEISKRMNYNNQNINDDYYINDDIIMRNNNKIQEKPIILPPISFVPSMSLYNSFRNKKLKRKKRRNSIKLIKSNEINKQINEHLNELNYNLTNKIYDENIRAIKSIEHLKNDYKNVSIMLENKIDQMQYIQQMNYEILKNILNNQNNDVNTERASSRRSISIKKDNNQNYLKQLIKLLLNYNINNNNKTEETDDFISEDDLRIIIQNQIKKKLELRRKQELENLRNQRKIENLIDNELNVDLINEMDKEKTNKNLNNIISQNNIPVQNNVSFQNNIQQTEKDNNINDNNINDKNINDNNENDNELKLIEKIYPLILDDNEIDHYIDGIKNKRDKGLLIEKVNSSIVSDSKKKKKTIKFKKQNLKKNNDFDHIEENEESNESGNNFPKAKFLIRGKMNK